MKLHLLFICLISACLQPKSSQLKNNDRLSKASNKLGSYEIYAHRGDFKFYAENTKQAFIDAFEKSKLDGSPNIVGIELDVQITKDGKIVVLHDQTLERTLFDRESIKPQYVDAPIETIDYADVKQAQLGPKKSDNLITLNDAVDLIRDDYRDKKILIELKSYKDAPASVTKKMLDSLEKSLAGYSDDVLKRLSFISFDENILKGLASYPRAKYIKRYAIYTKEDMQALSADGLRRKMQDLKNLGFAGIDLEMGDYLKDNKAIKFAHENQLKVITWPYFAKRGDGPRFQALARDVGVDIFTSDLPADTVLPQRLLRRARESFAFVESKLKNYSVKITDNEFDGVYYYELKKDRTELRAALYAPNQSDFSRGVDVSIGKAPTKDEIVKAMEIELTYLKRKSDFVVANFADSGRFTKEFISAFETVSRKLAIRTLVIEASDSAVNLNTIDAIRKNLSRPLELRCN